MIDSATPSRARPSERRLLYAVFATLLALSWLLTVLLMGSGPRAHATTFAALSWMWMAMMTAMMLPVVLPWSLVFAGASRGDGARLARTGLFVSGYFVVWAGFSLAAAGLQLGAHASGWPGDPGPAAAGTALLVAGAFQWTPLKRACLEHCRSPVAYFMRRWRDGPRGALVMGLGHGLYCLGCCWALMLLPLALGAMSLPWIAALTAWVAIENLTPIGPAFSRLSGLALMLAGASAVWLGLS